MDLSKKKILLWDLGLQSELAVTLAKKCAEVKYYVPVNMEIYPTPLKSFIGKGLEGIERVNKFFPEVEKADVIIIPESQLSGVVSHLRHLKYPVAGPGDEHAWLETERWESRCAQAEVGLPTQESESIYGLQDLEAFFETHKGWMVKGNGYRGLFDTFPIRDKKDLEPEANRLRYKLGPFANDFPFMVEEIKDGLETGYDTISWDKEQIWPSLLSLAAKDECYLCKVVEETDMPPGYRLMHKLWAEKLDGYRFFYSTETITGGDLVPYTIDMTMRIGSPSPLSIYLELHENFAEEICGMALGEKVSPKIRKGTKYAASVNLTLRQDENFTNIEIPKECRPYAKLVKGCARSGEYYTCPEWEVGVTVLGFGMTPQAAMKMADEYCQEIHGKGLVDNSDTLSQYEKDIAEAFKIGINF